MLDFFLRFVFRCSWIFWRIKRTYLTWIGCFAHAGRHWAGLANSFVIIVGLYEVCFSFKIMFLLLLELLYWSAVMVNIGWFLGPLNLVESFTVGTFAIIHFRLSFIQQLINLVDDHVDFVWWKLMKVPLWGHHEKRCNNYFAVEHEPDEFDVIVAVLFPEVVGRNVGEFGKPLVYSDLFVLAYFWEILMLNDFFINLFELLIIVEPASDCHRGARLVILMGSWNYIIGLWQRIFSLECFGPLLLCRVLFHLHHFIFQNWNVIFNAYPIKQCLSLKIQIKFLIIITSVLLP